MERIKLAIEKARAGEVDSPIPLPSRPRELGDPAAVAGKPQLAPVSELATDEPLSVQYANTPIVQLDEAHLEANRVVAHKKAHPASWAFDVLRTQVLQKMDENGWRTLAITSPGVDSGKTVVAINLAISIAQQSNRTALLVDFDLRRPSVANVLGLTRSVSLNDVLDGRLDAGAAMVNPGIERFVVLPTNRAVALASETLSSGKVGALIQDLRARYSDRIVLFDLPPVLAADDVMSLLPRVDCVLMVVGSGVSTQAEVEEAMSRLARANVLGVVLNKDRMGAENAYY